MMENLQEKKQFFGLLNERQKRLYAAMEAQHLGRSGVRLVSEAFMSLHQTAKKLGIKFLDYLKERNAGITPQHTIAQLVQKRYRNLSGTPAF